MTTYALDAETFINEIKKYKELWSLSCDGYKFKAKDKQLAWANVAKAFIPDFDSMKEVEKAEVYRKLHSKWRNIRDAYVRSLKRKDGKRAYMYAKLLTFLNTRYVDNHTSEGESEDESSDEAESVSINKSRNIEVTATSEDESSTIDNLKRRRVEKTDKIEFVETPNVQSESVHVSENEDRSFFDSLLPAVREFDLDQKLEFRCGVLKLIKQIRSKGNSLKSEFNSLDYD
ncbi:uncharacterized protein LOC123663361 [Melitaea cinxia]|uniref:uncharacterized protein LOC123663361 n=1 Tax=Melitaea cinxia TaxID=113334 RepID=UPI001E271B20|nr:uncharacterized protein LOC123663361 [Melitaea cinxia]